MKIPKNFVNKLKAVGNQTEAILRQLGSLEVEYVQAKARFMAELDRSNQERLRIVNAAAESLGLDPKKEKLQVDLANMDFILQKEEKDLIVQKEEK